MNLWWFIFFYSFLFLSLQSGSIIPVSVKVGEEVVLPEYGGTKLTIDDKDYFLFRDTDILAKYKPE